MIPHLTLNSTCFPVIDQFTADTASTRTNIPGHQLVFNKCLLR